MAIKKFGPPDPSPEANGNVPIDKNTGRSLFDPFAKTENARMSPLGERVFSAEATPDTARYDDDTELMEALLGQAELAFSTTEKLAKLYEKATRVPTGANVKAFSDALHEVIPDSELGRTTLGVAIATLVALARSGGKGPRPGF